MANNFVNWLISKETLTDIGNYGKDKYGKGLFTPMSSGVPPGVTADFTSPATETSPPVASPVVANGTVPDAKPV
jgi:tungstate transport system substrate-binding protein